MKTIKRMLMVSLTIITMILVVSCGYDPDYTYSWDIEVTYQNGDIDTIHHERASFNGNPVHLYIYTSGTLLNNVASPTLVTHCGIYKETITTGVRKFKILDETKILVVEEE